MILKENSCKDFGRNLFQIFWRKFVSKILEDNCSKEFGGRLFQRFCAGQAAETSQNRVCKRAFHGWRDAVLLF